MMYLLLSIFFAAVFVVMTKKALEFRNACIFGGIIGLVWLAINYFAMPVLSLWGYYGIWAELLITTVIGAIVYMTEDGDQLWQVFVPISVLGFIIVVAVGSSPMFHAKAYNNRLQVEEVAFENFSTDVNVISVEKMVVANASIARKVVEDRLEEDPGLGSRCYVGNMTMQQLTGSFTIDGGKTLTFDEDIVWVAPLEHSSFWKWVINDVTPGYMLVYANDPTKTYLITEVNGEKLALRFIETGILSDDIERHIRNHGYASQGITEFNFEIDSNGRPYWVLCNFKPTIGFWGYEAKGCITVDVQTGDVKQYPIVEAPAWVDHIQPAGFITTQITWWGELKHGWWNSIFAQRDVQQPTPGMVLVYSEGQTYWYTGIRSAGGDTSTSGFMLINARTKEARYYRVSGVNEREAERIAEEQNFAKAAQYDATSPVLYNVRGVPTYFMTLTGNSGNVMGYAFVAVTNRQAVGVGSSKKEAENNYLQALKRTAGDVITDGPIATTASKTYTVKDITFENGTYYILFEEAKGKEFSGSTEFFRELKWTRPGNCVNVTYSETNSDIIIIDSFDNVDFEF